MLGLDSNDRDHCATVHLINISKHSDWYPYRVGIIIQCRVFIFKRLPVKLVNTGGSSFQKGTNFRQSIAHVEGLYHMVWLGACSAIMVIINFSKITEKYTVLQINMHKLFLKIYLIRYFIDSVYSPSSWILLCQKTQRICDYRKVASSRPVYYSILELFGQRSQYISIKWACSK